MADQTTKSDLSGIVKPTKEEMSESYSEILVPSIIIVALFLINSFVLLAIYKYKKRKTALYTEEELGTMPIQTNGNMA